MTQPANDNAAPHFQLLRGEALKLLAEMPSDSVDAILTDPPYSSGGQFRGDRMQSTGTKYVIGSHQPTDERPNFTGDNRDQRAFGYWCALWLSECLRIAKPGSSLLMFVDWRNLPMATDAVQAGGWVWRGLGVWDKTEASRPRMGGLRSQSEFIVWATKGPQDQTVAKVVGCLPGVFRFPIVRREKAHQTGKPIALMESLVRICPPGGLVLDPFAGSATTLLAALKTGRRAIGFELVPEIAHIAEKRCHEAVGQQVASEAA